MTESYDDTTEIGTPEEEEDKYKSIKDKYRRAREHNAKWKRTAKRCYDFWAGRQWDDDVKTELEATGRAALVMNRIRPRVSAVVGMEIGEGQNLHERALT